MTKLVKFIDTLGYNKLIKGAYYKVLDENGHSYKIVIDIVQSLWVDKSCFVPDINVAKINKIELHQQICEKLNKIYEQKNTDYNDSFAKARKEINEYTLGKIYDKYERFKQLGRQENQVKAETIEDTLMDMANYTIMELLERGLDNG